MAKRIVSGIFILTALGALGVILAGALTSGEQLIVRFLTAVTVAALGLYVISDLRMQSEESELASANRTTVKRRTDNGPVTTAAYMATVTGQHVRYDTTIGDAETSPAAPVPKLETVPPTATPPLPPPIHAIKPEPDLEEVDPASEVEADGVPEPPAPILEGTVRTLPPHPNTALKSSRLANEQVRPFGDDGPATAIARSSYQYSGQLDADEVEWPPKPPSVDEDDQTEETPAVVKLVSVVTTSDDELNDEVPETPERARGDGTTTDDVVETVDDDGPEVTGEEAEASVSTHVSVSADDEDTEEHPNIPESITPLRSDQADTTGFEKTAVGEPASDLDAGSQARVLESAQYADVSHHQLLTVEPNDSPSPSRSPSPSPSPSAMPAASTAPSALPTPIPDGPPADQLTRAIQAGELQVVNTLIEQGMLSTTGPITDRDVRTMVYVAFTSNELRKLILAGGTPDGVKASDLNLGPVELFDESRFAPVPKTMYTPTPREPKPKTAEAVLDIPALEREQEPDDDVDDSAANVGLPIPKHLYRPGGIDVGADR